MKEIIKARRVVLLSATMFCGVAAAQQAVVEKCGLQTNDAKRIACLEAALIARDTDSATPGRQQAAAKAHEESGQEASTGSARGEDTDIGARQVELRHRTEADVAASLESATGLRVSRYSQVPYRRLQVELENGQVWRQIVGDTQRLRVDLERNQTVDIHQSRISGYKLRLNELGRTIRVERIR